MPLASQLQLREHAARSGPDQEFSQPDNHSMKAIRILLLNDQTLIRESIVRMLNAELGLQVVHACATVAASLAALSKSPVDIVLLDLDVEDGSTFLSRARQSGFEGRVLILTATADNSEAAQLVSEGVCGVFLKQSSPDRLVESIRKIVDGETWFDPRYVKAFLSQPDGSPNSGLPRFSPRERQVLKGVAEGLLNKQDSGKRVPSFQSTSSTARASGTRKTAGF